MSVVGMFVAYACFGWGVYRLWTGHITFGTMTLFVQLSGQLSSSFKSIVSLVPSAISATTSAGRIMEFFKIKDESDLEDDKAKLIQNNTQGKGLSVVLDDVEFSYNENKTVFKHADIVANPGEIVALVGPSGEGKTTMIRLLLGLINTKSGNASIRDINGVSCKISAGTRRFFAYVPQGNTIFSGTIAENMRMVKQDATDADDDCGVVEGDHMRCRAGITSFWMTWEGKMLPCGMIPDSGKDPWEVGFDEAWENAKNIVNEIKLPVKCAGCGKKDECRACAAMVYTETGTYDKVPQYRCEMTKNYPEACKKVLKELEQQL